jgi:hypothetical protein
MTSTCFPFSLNSVTDAQVSVIESLIECFISSTGILVAISPGVGECTVGSFQYPKRPRVGIYELIGGNHGVKSCISMFSLSAHLFKDLSLAVI